MFNGFTFFAFAFPLERAIGTPKFLALYATGLLVSDLGTWLRHRANREYRCLGASGAIGAVLFAAIFYFPAMSLFILPIPVPIPAPLFAAACMGYSIWATASGPPAALTAASTTTLTRPVLWPVWRSSRWLTRRRCGRRCATGWADP